MGAVIPFRLSTVVIAGPWSKKSTKMKLGAFPYAVLHCVAESPRLPGPPLGALVVVIFPTSGVSIPKSSVLSRKWFMSDILPDEIAVEISPFKFEGRSGRQVKFNSETFSNGFSKMKVNSSMRYEFVESIVEVSREATKVMRRVLAEMRVCKVGHSLCAVVVDCGM